MAFLGDITLGQYYPGRSFLHCLDPRSKIVASLVLMTCLLFAETIYSLLLFLFMAVLAWLGSGLPRQMLLRNLKPFFWLILITMTVHAFATEGQSLFVVPGLGWQITDSGLRNGFIYSFRLILLITFATFLTLTTPPMELTDGLERMMAPLKHLGIPVHELVLMMMLSLRFIPILILEAERIKNAQLSRGVSLDGNLMQRIKALVPMIVPLLVLAVRRAEDLAIAMEARGYSGGKNRTSFRQLSFTKKDVIALALIGVISIFTFSLG